MNMYQSDKQEENLNQIMEFSLDNDAQLIFIEKLKFRNEIYSPDDNIALLGKEEGERQLYGKILLIAKTSKTQFPVLLVAWYFGKEDPIIAQQEYGHVAKKQLIFSEYEDWQYIESVKGKITVLDQQQFRYLNPKEREEDRLFFCRSYILPGSPALLNVTPRGVCHCMIPLNPDDILVTCVVCGVRFHPNCSGNDQICIVCQ